MKSVKPGRGPSMMGGVVGIFMVIVGLAWTFGAMSMGAPIFMGIFGLAWTGIALTQCIYNFKNATGKNRYSSFDIVDGREEPDPFNRRFGMSPEEREMAEAVMAAAQSEEEDSKRYAVHTDGNVYDDDDVESVFCPFCGAKVLDGFEFCNKCGKKLP